MLLKRIPTPPPALPTLMTSCAGSIYIFFLTPFCFASFCGKKNPSGKEKVISLFRLTFLRENEVRTRVGQKNNSPPSSLRRYFFARQCFCHAERRKEERRGSEDSFYFPKNKRGGSNITMHTDTCYLLVETKIDACPPNEPANI